ncbi:MAG: alkylmercury lyase family protein [Candidatus Nitrosotenuis sp.]
MTGNVLSDNNCCENMIPDDVGIGIKRIFDLERVPTSFNDLNSLIQRSHDRKSEDLAVLSYIGRHFIENKVFPHLDLVAKDLDIEPSRLNQIVSVLEGSGYLTFGKNVEIVGACGMSASSTSHLFYLGDRPINVWCAIDALGIPLVLGINAEVKSKCSHCGDKIGIKTRGGDLEEYNNDNLVFVGFSGKMEGKIVKDLCPYLNFFCSLEHLQEWKKSRPDIRGMGLSLPVAAELSKIIFESLSKK